VLQEDLLELVLDRLADVVVVVVVLKRDDDAVGLALAE